MKKLANLLAAAVLVVSLSTSAFAQAESTTTIQTTTVTTTVNNDAAVIAALAALNAGYARYDMLIMGILNHSQRIDYAAMEKHADWYLTNPLTRESRNGYLAYLEQRLHPDADQEHEAARIEGHFLAEILPLYTAWQESITAFYAAQRTTVQTTTVATPPPAVETTTVETAPPQKVEVQEAPPPAPQKKFIRNTDMK